MEQLRPNPLLTGEDLKRLGLKPGPIFKQILSDLEDRQLEGVVTDRDTALAYVKTHFVAKSVQETGDSS